MSDSQKNVIQGGPDQPFDVDARQPEKPHGPKPAGGTFSIGGIIGRTFETLMKNPAVFFGLAFSFMIPPAIVEALLPMESPLKFGLMFVELLLGFIVQGSVAYAVYQVMQGKAVSIGGAISRGASALVPLILTSFLASLGMMLGMVFLIIPGLILWSMWFVAIPACVVEKTGPVASLKRSAFLTKGFRWQIFGLVILSSVLIVVLVGAITFLLFSIMGSYPMAVLIGSILGVAPQAFACVLYAIVYHDLRVIKEGVSLENLTSVFE